MNDRALEDPQFAEITEEDRKILSGFLANRPLMISFSDPKTHLPEDKTDCLLKIHLLGEAAGYYDDIYILMTGGYRSKNKQWYYYDITGRYDLDKNYGEVVGWRYFEDE